MQETNTSQDRAATTAGRGRCPVCQREGMAVFFELEGVPVHCNVLWETQDEARQAPRGDIRLAFCEGCGHIYNMAFDPALMHYDAIYENSLHFSPRFQQFAEGLADRLITRHALRDKTVIDVGCGKGDFLKLICERGACSGVGFDRSYDPANEDEALPPGVRFVQDFYGPQYTTTAADLLTCRHVLEHIEQPRDFVADIRQTIGGHGTAVYFEVPNARYTLRDLGIWDVIYEHCSYFSAASLARVFADSGFDVLAVGEAYGGQFLGVDAAPGSGVIRAEVPPLAVLAAEVAAFAAAFREKVVHWRATLADLHMRGQRVAVWGAGSKGVTFLNVLKASDAIPVVIDINPRKQGRFVAGTGQPILAPEQTTSAPPDAVIIMNPLYTDEIRGMLADLGQHPALLTM